MVNGPQLSLTRPAAGRAHDAMVRISAYICRVKRQAPVKHSSQPSFLPSQTTLALVWSAGAHMSHQTPLVRIARHGFSAHILNTRLIHNLTMLLRLRDIGGSRRIVESKHPTAERRQYSLIVSHALINHIGVVINRSLGPSTVKCSRSADRPADPASEMPPAVHGMKGSAMPDGVCHLAARPNCTYS
jgi:hypothetical protein